MKIVFLITKVVTWPGAFLKGFWEHVACRTLKLRVTDRSYLPADWHCGHARHEPAMSPARAWFLALLPYIPQRILGWLFLGASFAPILLFGLRGKSETQWFWPELVALFLGLSLLCNSFPQWDDAKLLWHVFYSKPDADELEVFRPKYAGLAGKIIFAPANAFFMAGAWLERHGIPAFVTLAVTIAAIALKY